MSGLPKIHYLWHPEVPLAMREYWDNYWAKGYEIRVNSLCGNFSMRFFLYYDPHSAFKSPQCRFRRYPGGLIDTIGLLLPERGRGTAQSWMDQCVLMNPDCEPGFLFGKVLECWKRSPEELTRGTRMVNPMRKERVLEE